MSARPLPLRRALPALVATAALALSGCQGDGSSINEQMRQGDQKGYVSGDGAIESLTSDQRDTEISLTGTTLEDEAWDLADHRGEVVVVNVWGSWCAPCVAEAPDLAKAAQAYADAGQPVSFIGVNVRDTVPNALAFEKKYAIPYPSLQDDGGHTVAQLGSLGVARPTTLVVDPQGRLAARVSGQVSGSTLQGLVDDVLAEGGATTGDAG